MRFGLFSGILWGLDTVVLGIALSMAPFIDTPEAIAFAAVASSFLHDAACAIWLAIYMGIRGRLKDTLAALKTRSGLVVIAGALLGGPIGMTGYVIAINNIGAAYTAIISAFYPALGAFLSYVLLKEKMSAKQIASLIVALFGVMAMGYISAGDSEMGNTTIGLVGAILAVIGWGSEAVLCAWGMKDDAVDNETALQIRETASALVYGIAVLPLFGAWGFTAHAIPTSPRASSHCPRLPGPPHTSSTTRAFLSLARQRQWRSTSHTLPGQWPLALSCKALCQLPRQSSSASSSLLAPFSPRQTGTSYLDARIRNQVLALRFKFGAASTRRRPRTRLAPIVPIYTNGLRTPRISLRYVADTIRVPKRGLAASMMFPPPI